MTENKDKQTKEQDLSTKTKQRPTQPAKTSDGLIPTEISEKLPPEIREQLEIQMLSMSSGPMPNPITKHLTPEHVGKALEFTEKRDERLFKNAGFKRRYTLLYIVIGIGLFVFLTLFFGTKNPALYKDILIAALGALGGFGGGFAYRGSKNGR